MALPLDLTSLWTALSGASSPPLVAAAREALACAAAHEGAQPEVEVRLGRMSGSAGGGGESFVAGLAQAEWEAAQSALYQRSGWKSAPTEVRPHTFSLLARVAFFCVRRLPISRSTEASPPIALLRRDSTHSLPPLLTAGSAR